MRKALAPLVASLLFALPAVATRIAVAPFSGPKGSAVRTQLVRALCDAAECVPQAKVTAGGKPNWKKARKEKVAFFVTGKVVKKGKKESIELAVLTGAGKPKLKKSFVLQKGALAEAGLTAASDSLFTAMKLQRKAEPPPPEPEPQPEPVPEPVVPPSVASEPPKEEPPPLSESTGRAERVAMAEPIRSEEPLAAEPPPEVKARVPARKGKQPLVVPELTVDLFSRGLVFSEAQTKNLRSYQALLVSAPGLKVEVFPLSRMGGFLAGAGAEAGYGFAVGLKSRACAEKSEDGSCLRFGPDHPTSASRLDLAAKMRLSLFSDLPLTLVPHLGYRRDTFSVGAAPDGSVLDGLPAVTYSALSLGATGEMAFPDLKLLAFAGFSYLPVLSSGEIISPAYFSGGSASGLEATLGAGYMVTPEIEVRAVGQLTQFGLRFNTQPTDAYIAAGATDRHLGARLAVRWYVF